MSSFYAWDELEPETRASIEVQTTTGPDEKRCGCHLRGERWWLCQYHVGYEDGVSIVRDATREMT
jgi:hypothetical protein